MKCYDRFCWNSSMWFVLMESFADCKFQKFIQGSGDDFSSSLVSVSLSSTIFGLHHLLPTTSRILMTPKFEDGNGGVGQTPKTIEMIAPKSSHQNPIPTAVKPMPITTLLRRIPAAKIKHGTKMIPAKSTITNTHTTH